MENPFRYFNTEIQGKFPVFSLNIREQMETGSHQTGSTTTVFQPGAAPDRTPSMSLNSAAIRG